jgi:mannosyltransferase OCH1-like enzyme
MIPKIVMQTWKNHQLPEHWEAGQISVKKHLIDHGWRHVFMTNEDNWHFVQTHFPQYAQVYQNLPYDIQRADMIRYMWLYVHGGLYLDMDFLVNRPLEPLFTTVSSAELYLIQSPNGHILTNCFMASQPRCPFWLECLEYIRHYQVPWYYTKHFHVLCSTGPFMLQYVYQGYGQAAACLIPSQLVLPCKICEVAICRSTGYLKQVTGQTWNAWDSWIFNLFYCYPGKCMFLVAMLLVLVCLLIWQNFQQRICQNVCLRVAQSSSTKS